MYKKTALGFVAVIVIAAFLMSMSVPAFAEANSYQPQLQMGGYTPTHVGERTAKTLEKKAIKSYTKNTVTVILGDVDRNGSLNTGDAVYVLKSASDMITLDDIQKLIADANENGVLNTGDAVVILRVCAGLEDEKTIEINLPDDEVKSYTVTYVSGVDDETVSVPAQTTVKAGEQVTIDPAYLSCSGFEFKGYTADFDGKLYTPGESFTMPEKDVVLTGTWEKQQQEGAALVINVHDIFNDTVVKSETVYLKESTKIILSDANIAENFKAYNKNTEFSVSVNGDVASPASVTFEVYKVIVSGGVDYVAINTAKGVDNIRMQCSWNFMLENDISMRSIALFTPIGWGGINEEITYFTGVIDGNGYEISSLCCDYWDASPYYATCVGLVSINCGTIRNLTVFSRTYEEDPSSYGVFAWQGAGIVCGRNEGLIEYCLAQGLVGSSDCEDPNMGTAGGLCGENVGEIRCCGANVGAEGFYYIGGLIGKNFGTVDQCWFAGGINTSTGDQVINYYGIRYVGGLCGGASGVITNCYVICMDSLCAYGGIGGLIGQGYGCVVSNVYVAYSEMIYCTSYQYVDTFIGFKSSAAYPTINNNYAFNSASSLPAGFNSTIWDFKGASYPQLPDLINARRPD